MTYYQTAPTIGFFSQGCRLNHSETAIFTNQFSELGFETIDWKLGPDFVVINTCTVTENGDQDAKRLVQRIHQTNKSTKIALVGCLSQIQKDQLLSWPGVHWVIGNAQKMSLARYIAEGADQPVVDTPKIPRTSFKIEASSVDPFHKRANLKIQDGCDFYCSFCVIPFARGPARCRDFDDLMRDAHELVASGHHEIVLTGVNIGTYELESYQFIDVVNALSKVNGLHRLRISSIEPTTIPYELIDMMADPDHPLCPYLHIPLQSGSDSVLVDMARKYDRQQFINDIRLFKKQVPNICIGSDIMVGYPTESEADFEQTLDLVREEPIDYAHVFSYSERPLARSKKHETSIPSAVIKQRSQQLRELVSRKKALFISSQLGSSLDVLFEQQKKDHWVGTTSNFIRVYVSSTDSLENETRAVTLTTHFLDGALGNETFSG